jgi:hypothetical protein
MRCNLRNIGLATLVILQIYFTSGFKASNLASTSLLGTSSDHLARGLSNVDVILP